MRRNGMQRFASVFGKFWHPQAPFGLSGPRNLLDTVAVPNGWTVDVDPATLA